LKVHAALAATLAGHEVKTLFGLLGDGNMFFVDSFIRDHNGSYVAAANEAGAVLMASGYASGIGHFGVATVTHGPGLANALAVLVSAARERLPVVLIAGDIGSNRREHTQKIDQSAIVAPTGAGFEEAFSATSAPADLVRAIRRALIERRPIVFNVPVGLTFEESGDPPRAQALLPSARPAAPDPAAMDVAVGLLAGSRRPIVLAGAGCVAAGAAKPLKRLADALGAPLATTLPAKGLFSGDSYDLGVFGTLSTERAVDAILAADCIVAVGASLNRLTAGGDGWPFVRGKRLIHCDVDPAVIGSRYPADGPVVADASTFAEEAVRLLEEIEHVPTSFRERLRAVDASEPPQRRTATVDRRECVSLTEAMLALNQALPPERSVVVDGGRFAAEAVMRLDVPRPQSWACSFRGFGAVGGGLATALGLGCAIPNAPVAALVGDGGFMLGGLAEFNTAVRYGIDLIAVVCNDGAYGAEYRKLRDRDFGVEASLFNWPDFAPVAEALGGCAFTVRKADDLGGMREAIAKREGPLLIDIKLDPAGITAGH
jgi:acetolactate synthase-1/2/3 large subunit